MNTKALLLKAQVTCGVVTLTIRRSQAFIDKRAPRWAGGR